MSEAIAKRGISHAQAIANSGLARTGFNETLISAKNSGYPLPERRVFDPVIIEGKEIKIVTSTKLLGPTIANDITWNEITKKASKRLYFLTQLKRAGVPKQDLAKFHVSCVRSVIDYAAPVFFNGLPQYLKNEMARLEKRPLSIITSGNCKLAVELGVIPILEHHYVLCSKLFDNTVSGPNHKVKALLPRVFDNSRYMKTAPF